MSRPDPLPDQLTRGCVGGPHVAGIDDQCVWCANVRLGRANARLSSALTHVINRVSTEGRDDEHGLIFHVGKWAIHWAECELDGSAADRPSPDDNSTRTEGER